MMNKNEEKLMVCQVTLFVQKSSVTYYAKLASHLV